MGQKDERTTSEFHCLWFPAFVVSCFQHLGVLSLGERFVNQVLAKQESEINEEGS